MHKRIGPYLRVHLRNKMFTEISEINSEIQYGNLMDLLFQKYLSPPIGMETDLCVAVGSETLELCLTHEKTHVHLIINEFGWHKHYYNYTTRVGIQNLCRGNESTVQY